MVWQPDYVTLAEAKEYLRIEDAEDDTMIGLWITTASRAVDGWCGRQFGKVAAAEARVYTPMWDRHLGRYVANVDDLADDDDLTIVDADANAVTSYSLSPDNAPLKGRPYERIISGARGPITVDSPSWGWAAVPASIRIATLLQVARLAIRRDSPYGIAGSPTEGSEVRLTSALDADVRSSIPPALRRTSWAA